ncbi:MAG: hypothetical protein JNJ88_13955 [Planctomycetes bacterium]|nr:hypothetical protein [Planctomycetota bacterium]
MRTLLAAVLLASSAIAQKSAKEEICPWCKNDVKILAAAGCVSHGPMQIGKKGSSEHSHDYPGKPWIYLETAHFRWATSMGSEPVSLKDRPRVEAELARLRKAMPSIPTRVATLDPHLRLHLTAMKAEELYTRFQAILAVQDGDFPDSRQPTGPYMGDGRFLGEKEKFEVVLHSNRKTHHMFTKEQMGVLVTDALRWHFPKIHKMCASLPAEDGDLRQDTFLFPHIAHCTAHLLFCAYKHFSFDPPIWLDEGLAHALEFEAGKDFNVTYCSEEGAAPDRESSGNWAGKAKELLEKGKATSLAELMHRKTFGELTKEDHVTAWSKVRFLLDTRAVETAKFLGLIKGQLDEQGYPSNKDLPGLQRRSLKECYSWTPEQFDDAWAAWVKKPPATEPKK